MRVEMNVGERDCLQGMLEGPVTPAIERAYYIARRALLRVGCAIPFDRMDLALVVMFAELAGGTTEANLVPTPIEQTNGHVDAGREAPEVTPNNGEYTGPRQKFDNPFPDVTPDTPLDKLPKGYPVMYRDDDSVLTAARFRSLSKGGKALLTVAGKKGVVSVERDRVTPQDLSPPSPIPRSVAI